jgi:hypothetical protein
MARYRKNGRVLNLLVIICFLEETNSLNNYNNEIMKKQRKIKLAYII